MLSADRECRIFDLVRKTGRIGGWAMDYYDGNQCRDVAIRLGLNNCAFRFTAWAYIWRAGRKPGQDGKEDIQKACNYLRWLRAFPSNYMPSVDLAEQVFKSSSAFAELKSRMGEYRIELLKKVASVVSSETARHMAQNRFEGVVVTETALILELLRAKFDSVGNIIKGDL